MISCHTMTPRSRLLLQLAAWWCANSVVYAFQLQNHNGLFPHLSMGLPKGKTSPHIAANLCHSTNCQTIRNLSLRRQPTFLSSRPTEDKEEEETNPPQESANIPQPAPSQNKKSLSAQITFSFFKFFSYAIQFLGAAFTVGLILNLMGYGYRFDFDHGLEINRLENIRNEIQFEREIIREERGAGGYNSDIVIGNWGKSILSPR